MKNKHINGDLIFYSLNFIILRIHLFLHSREELLITAQELAKERKKITLLCPEVSFLLMASLGNSSNRTTVTERKVGFHTLLFCLSTDVTIAEE